MWGYAGKQILPLSILEMPPLHQFMPYAINIVYYKVMKMLMERFSTQKKSRTSRYNIIFLILQLCFMLCVFGPLSWYLPNRSEFWFSFRQMMFVSTVLFAISFVVLNSIGNIIAKNRKLALIAYDAVLALNIYLYIQGNFIPRNYGLLDGVEIDWKMYTGYANASIILIVICAVAAVVGFFLLKERLFLVGKYTAIFLLLVQIITMGALAIQYPDTATTNSPRIVTKENLLNFSKDENIVIFVLDAFDSSYMMEALNGEKKEFSNYVLKDFTYYPDTVGAYPSTRGALPLIFTGVWNDNSEKYRDYIKSAFDETEIYDMLTENEFIINLYAQADRYISDATDFCSNIYTGDYFIPINKLPGMHETTFKLTLYNYAPHQFKKYFYVNSDDFNRYSATNIDDGERFLWDILDFYNYFKKNGINNDASAPTFKIYHVSGTHPEYTFDENLFPDKSKKYTVMDETYGNIELFHQFFDTMKQKGIYENSTIILMADHGSEDFNANPLFMIKNKAESHAFPVVSRAKMSFDYLADIYKRLAVGEPVDESYINSFDSTKRKFYYYLWITSNFNKEYLPTITEYYCEGNAYNWDDFYMSGEIYQDGNNTVDYRYKLGTILDYVSIDDSKNVEKYTLYGISSSESYGSWTYDTFANIRFDVNKTDAPLMLTMSVGLINDKSQEVKFRVNGTDIATHVFTGAEDYILYIPNELISDGLVNITMLIPDAKRPENGDLRKLGICLSTICLKQDSG